MSTNPTNIANAACRGTCRAQSITSSRGAWVYGSLKELRALQTMVEELQAEVASLKKDQLPTATTDGQFVRYDGTSYKASSLDGVAIGPGTNETTLGISSVAIGVQAISSNNHSIVINATGIGLTSSQDSALFIDPIRTDTVSTTSPLKYNLTTNEVVVGDNPALYELSDCNTALSTAVSGMAIVRNAAGTEWIGTGETRIALGNGTDNTLDGPLTTAVGFSNTGNAHILGASSTGAIAIGVQAAADSTGATNNSGAIAIGVQAGETGQSTRTIAMGYLAGRTNQATGAVAIGGGCGVSNQGTLAVAMGTGAGQISQGAYAVALGNNAGVTSQAANSIVINATGSPLNNTVASTCVVKPVRGDVAQAGALTNFIPPTGFDLVGYNPTTGEFIHYTST